MHLIMSNFIITILQHSMIYLDAAPAITSQIKVEGENILPFSARAQQCTAPSKDQKTGLSV